MEAGAATSRWRPQLAAVGARPDPAARARCRALRHDGLLARRSHRQEPAARRRVRRPTGRVQPRRDPRPRHEPAGGRADDRLRHGRRRDRPLHLDGPAELGRLRSSTIVIPYHWVEDDPISVGVTSSSGIETVEEVPAAVETPSPSAQGFLGYAIIGFLVGVLPVALGLLWLPSLRRADPKWLAAFMALTAGLLPSSGSKPSRKRLSCRPPSRLARQRRSRLARRRHELPDDDLPRPSNLGEVQVRSPALRWRRSSRSESASTTSGRGSRSARRSPSAS